MSWQTDYRSKLTTPARALAPLPGDAMLYLSGNAATPRVLCEAPLR